MDDFTDLALLRAFATEDESFFDEANEEDGSIASLFASEGAGIHALELALLGEYLQEEKKGGRI